MIRIKLFGEGCHIHLLESSENSMKIYKSIAKKMKLPLEEALLDIGFCTKLNTDIQEIDQLIIDSFGGLLPVSPVKIEIWFKRRKAAKIPFQELLYSSTLFPLFQVKKINTTKNNFDKGIYLRETVIGCIGVYEFSSDTFNINQLSFTLLSSVFTNSPLLISFTYQNFPLKKVKEDCLTKHQEIIIL
jgi:hypothetical protein